MKPVLLPALGLIALTLPSFVVSQPFDHHDLPLDTPDPFTGAQQDSPCMEQIDGACREPEPPLSDPASLDTLGLTHRQEVLRYFDEANAYLMCLERTKGAFIAVVSHYSDLYINTP